MYAHIVSSLALLDRFFLFVFWSKYKKKKSGLAMPDYIVSECNKDAHYLLVNSEKN